MIVTVVVLVALAGCGSDEADGHVVGDVEAIGNETETANAVVLDVVDGDTIVVEVDGRDERVRLIGIDTPETKHPTRPVECYGPEASEFTASLLPTGTAILLERDLVGRDDYGRLLGYVHVPATGIFVNREIVRRGYARPLTIEPNITYVQEFAADARAAERDDVGIWAECRG